VLDLDCEFISESQTPGLTVHELGRVRQVLIRG